MDALVNLQDDSNVDDTGQIRSKNQKITNSRPGNPSDMKKIQPASRSVPRHSEKGGLYPTVLAALCDLHLLQPSGLMIYNQATCLLFFSRDTHIYLQANPSTTDLNTSLLW
jgi:hypothetical protein